MKQSQIHSGFYLRYFRHSQSERVEAGIHSNRLAVSMALLASLVCELQEKRGKLGSADLQHMLGQGLQWMSLIHGSSFRGFYLNWQQTLNYRGKRKAGGGASMQKEYGASNKKSKRKQMT